MYFEYCSIYVLQRDSYHETQLAIKLMIDVVHDHSQHDYVNLCLYASAEADVHVNYYKTMLHPHTTIPIWARHIDTWQFLKVHMTCV